MNTSQENLLSNKFNGLRRSAFWSLNWLHEGKRGLFLLFMTGLLLIMTGTGASASHFRYGDINWKVDPADPSGRTIIFTLNTGWATSPGHFLNFGDGTQQSFAAIFTGSANGAIYYTGTVKHTYASNGSYKAFFGSCCKIFGLQNNSSGSWYVYTAVNVGTGNNSPVTSLPAIVNVQQGLSSATFNVPASDPDGNSLSYRMATTADGWPGSNPAGMSISSTGQVTWSTVGKSIGQLWNAAVIISDNNGSEILVDFLMNITQQSSPPVFDYTAGNTPADGTTYQLAPGQNLSFNVVAHDNDPGSNVRMSASGMPVGASVSPGFGAVANPITHTFNWTPTSSQLGTYVVNFVAQDNNGVQASSSVAIQVSLKPVFDMPPTPASLVFTPGSAVNFTVQASDNDNTDLVRIVSATGMPSGAILSNSLPTAAANPISTNFSWNTTAADWGEHEITFTAQDSYGDKTSHKTEILINTLPVFSTTTGTSVVANTPLNYTITAYDPDMAYGDHMHIHVIGILPSWMTVTDNGDGTATVTGTPSVADAGTHSIQLMVEDHPHHSYPAGTYPQQNFDFEVVPCNTTLAASATDASCPGGNDGAIDLTISGGTAPFSILWSNGATTEDLNGISAGSYTVTVEDANNCVETLSISIDDQDGLAPVAIAKNITVQLDANGEAAIAAGDVNDGSSDNCGIQSMSVSPDAFDCSNVGSANAGVLKAVMTVDNQYTVYISNSPTLAGTQFGSGNNWATVYTHTTNLSPGTNYYLHVLAEDVGSIEMFIGDFTLTGDFEFANGTQALSTNTTDWTYSNTAFGVNSQTPIDIGPNGLGPWGFKSGISASTRYIWGTPWNTSGGNVAYFSTPITYTGVQNLVTLTVTDNSGNVSTSTANVTVEDNIAPSVPSSTGTASISLPFGNTSGWSPWTYTFNDPTPTGAVITGIDLNFSAVDQGWGGTGSWANMYVSGTHVGSAQLWHSTNNYNLSYTGSIPGWVDGGNNTLQMYFVGWPGWVGYFRGGTMTIHYTVPASVHKTIQLDANGQASVTVQDLDPGFSDACGLSSVTISQSNFTCSDVGDNDITVTATDIHGNVATFTALVTVTSPALTATLSSADINGFNVSCNGGNNGSIDATVTGGCQPYSYSWSNNASTEDLSGLEAGAYTLTVTDFNGKTTTATITLTEPSEMVASISSVNNNGYNISCNGGNNGNADLNVSGGVAPYTYAWSNNSTAEDLNGLTAGTYSVTVTDVNGCSVNASVTLTEPSVLTATASSATYNGYNISCNGGSNGNADLTVTGGVAPYTYAWSNNTTTEDLSGLTAGTYSVTVTDANGCSVNTSVTLTEPNVLTASASSATYNGYNISCNGGSNGNADLTVTGGVAPYTYVWSNSASTEDLSGLTAGTYAVTVTDANGCSANASITLTEPTILATSGTIPDHNGNGHGVSCYGYSDGEIDLSVSGGVAPYTYAWSHSASTEDVAGLVAGTYTVTVTDANGCNATVTFDMTQPGEIIASFGALADVCVDAEPFALITGSQNVESGTGVYSGHGVNSTTGMFDPASAGVGTHMLTYHFTDLYGCSDFANQPITVNPLPVVTFGTLGGVCANAPAYALTQGMPAGGTYSGNGVTGGNFDPAAAGVGIHTLTYTYTDPSTGCTNFATQVITVLDVPVANAGADQTVFYGYDPMACATLSGSATGGTGTYSYSWSNGSSMQSTKVCPTSTTIYTLTVTDQNGCSTTDEVTINVIDVHCGNKNDKVLMCHNGNEICISKNAVASHLAHNGNGNGTLTCYLGPCGSQKRDLSADESAGEEEIFGHHAEEAHEAIFTAYPNPFSNTARVVFISGKDAQVKMELIDIQGRVLETLYTGQVRTGMRTEADVDGSTLPAGVYLVRLTGETETQHLRLILAK